MTSSHHHFEEHSYTPTAPPPPPAPKKRRKISKPLMIGISAGIVLALGIGGGAVAYSSNSEKLAEYEDARGLLSTSAEAATDVLDTIGALEPATQEELEEQIAAANSLLEADAPSVMSFDIDDRTSELVDGRSAIRTLVTDLETATESKESYSAAVEDGEELLSSSEELLEKTQDKILDEDAYEKLSGHVEELKNALDEEPDETSADSFAEHASAITSASDAIDGSTSAVSTSHDEWVEAEEEKANRDPSNYKTISERDWQLVERDPDSYEGEKYVLYGVVTQADAMTGDATIRVNTGPVQQSRRYEYDVNTMVLAGASDVFSDVVQDDHVKMLVEVNGSLTYDTTIGGSASAVMALAYDVEVIGEF